MNLEDALPDEPFLTCQEAADLLRVSRKTIYEHLKRNPKLAVKPNGSTYRIIKSNFIQWIESGMKREVEGKETAESTTAPLQ